MSETFLAVTCMKNEGPFILEWIAYHRAIGFTDFLVFTNDCTDGTDTILERLQGEGVLQTMDNPYARMEGNYNPQKGALRYSEDMDIVKSADWIMVMDVDEFVNIHVGDGTLADLLGAVGDIDCISMMWRLFGNSDVLHYEDRFVTEQFDLCAPHYCPSPIQAWAVKTMFRTRGKHAAGKYKRIGVHRPLSPIKETLASVRWVNGSGEPVLDKFLDSGWRFGTHSCGYDLVTLNHYAVRSAESFVVKRDRGRVNHVDRDQGLAYWLRMNFNMERDTSIRRHLPRAKKEFDRLLALPGVKELHMAAVQSHRDKIAELMSVQETAEFYTEITSKEMRLLSRHLNLIGRDIFDEGPAKIDRKIIERISTVPDLLA